MGDPIEITTWPKHQNIFYRVTTSAMMFDIKAQGNAVVGLTRKPGTRCDYWVCIGDGNSRSWIRKEDDHGRPVNTQSILSSEEYRRFWITWHGDSIKLGRNGQTKPLVTYGSSMPDLKYVTFTTLGERNPIHWKFELPPLMERPRKLKTVSGGKPHWVGADNQLPDGAMIGGFEKESLYIIRAFHRGSLTPGKFVPSEGSGYIPWGGRSNETGTFEVLCGFDCTWVPSTEDRIPVGAVEGGHSEDHHERLYVGRAVHEGHLIPGKVQPSHKVCYIPYDGQEIAKKSYEILVEPYINSRCVNKMFVSEVVVDSASDSDNDNDVYSNHSWGEDEDVDNYDSNDEVYAF